MISLLLAIIQFLIITHICYYEYKLKSSAVFMWLVLWLMFGVTHLITVTTEKTTYPMWVLDTASLFVVLFCLLYIITRRLIKINSKVKTISLYKVENYSSRHSQYFEYILLTFFFIIIGYKGYQIYTFSGSFFNSSWGSNIAIYAKNPMSNVVLWYYFITSGVLLISLLKKKKIIFILVLTLIVLNSIISRNRVEIIPVFVTVLSYLLFKGRISLKKISLMIVLPFLIVYIVYGLRVFRHYGTIEMFIDSFDFTIFNNLILEYIMTSNGELSLKDVFYYFIYNNNQFPNFEQGHTYIRMLLVLFPTSLTLGIKPPDFAQSMGYAVDPGILKYSTHPTLFGDCFANLGFAGVFLGIFWAIFFSLTDYMVNRQDQILKLSLFSLCSVVFIILARGSVYNSFSILVWGCILLAIIYKSSKYITTK